MKKLIPILALAIILPGCISPKWIRLVPENKDADIEVFTLYGRIIIHSRVNPEGRNALMPLPVPQPSPLP